MKIPHEIGAKVYRPRAAAGLVIELELQEGQGAGAPHHPAGGRVQAGPGGRLPRHPLRAAPHRTLEVGFCSKNIHTYM